MEKHEFKTLHLTLKKEWFDMVLSGEKKEEYRELKSFWKRRLEYFMVEDDIPQDCFREFDLVHFTHGYGSLRPQIIIECKDISIGRGKYEWGGLGTTYIIKLGAILETRNIKDLPEYLKTNRVELT